MRGHPGVAQTAAGASAFPALLERIDNFCLEAMNIGGHALVEESGELQVIDLLARASRDGRPLVVWDVGAHRGDFAEKVISRLPESRLTCLEPSRQAFAELARRLGHHPGVELLNAGLGEREEEVPLYSHEEGSPLSSVYRRRLDHFGLRMDRSELVRLARLDALGADGGIDHIDLLKLDVEGHELHSLRGAGVLVVAQRIDMIQFEFGGCNIDSCGPSSRISSTCSILAI